MKLEYTYIHKTLDKPDTDARWTKKGNETHYGYKDHAKVDADSKIIFKKKGGSGRTTAPKIQLIPDLQGIKGRFYRCI